MRFALPGADIERLGWTLIHSVWELALVAALSALVLRLLDQSSAAIRYRVGCAALGAMVALPVATFVMVDSSRHVAAEPAAAAEQDALGSSAISEAAPSPRRRDVNPATLPMRPVSASVSGDDQAHPIPGDFGAESTALRDAASAGRGRFQPLVSMLELRIPWLVAGWTGGVALLSLWHLGGFVVLRRFKRCGTAPPANWSARVCELARDLRIRRPVRLLECRCVTGPAVVGWLRPIILVPAGLLSGSPPEHIELVLIHELAHVRRHDWIVNLLQTIAETVLFYHPGVWWISRRLRQEREHCADDLAVAASGDRFAYARALVTLEERAAGRPPMAIAADGGDLKRRIRHVLGLPPQGLSRHCCWPAGLMLALALGAAVGIVPLQGQSSSGEIAAQPGTDERTEAAAAADPDTAAPQTIPAVEKEAWPDLAKVERVFNRPWFAHWFRVMSLDFTSDGKQLLTGSKHGLRVWDTDTGDLLREIPMDALNGIELDLSSDDRVLILASDKGQIRVLEWPSCKLIRELADEADFDRAYITCVAADPRGSRVAIGYHQWYPQDPEARERYRGPSDVTEGGLKLWDIASGELLFEAHADQSVLAAGWSPAGDDLLVGRNDGTIDRLHFKNRRFAKVTALDPPDPIVGLAIDPTGERVAAVTAHGSAGMWELNSGKPVWYTRAESAGQRLIMHGARGGIAIDPTGRRIYASSVGSRLASYNAETGQGLHTSTSRWGHALALSRDGSRLAVSHDGGLDLLDGETLHDAVQMSDPLPIGEILPSPDGRTLLATGGDSLSFWETATGRLIGTYQASKDIVTAAWHRDGRVMAVVRNADRSNPRTAVNVVDAGSRRLVASLPIADFSVHRAKIASDGTRLVGVAGRELYVWSLADSSLLWQQTAAQPGDGLEAAAISPDGQTTAVIVNYREDKYHTDSRRARDASGGEVRLFEMATGKHTGTLYGQGMPTQMAFSPNGRILFTSVEQVRFSVDAGAPFPAVIYWDMQTHSERGRIALDEHPERGCRWMALSSDGNRIAIPFVSHVDIWDVERRELVESFDFPGGMNGATFMPDGTRLATRNSNYGMFLLKLTE